MSTAVDTMKTFMGVLKNYSSSDEYVGITALDNAIRTTTTFASAEEAVDIFKNALKDTEKYPDTDTRLLQATGMILGAKGDKSVDTGAISGSNAGGSTVKNAQDIVPESGDLSTATMPTAGSTTPITYTGADGNSYTFYVKWPDSFTTVIHGFNKDDGVDNEARLTNRRYYVDFNNLDDNEYYTMTTTEDGETKTENSPTYGQMKSAIETIAKGLNTYWLKEAAKLNYDSLGLALDGQTIEIAFVAGDLYDDASAITFSHRNDFQPSDHIIIAIDLFNYGNMDSTDANGKTAAGDAIYLDRVIAREMVHAVMYATGTFKKGMPQFFTEGVADLVQGDDDDNAEQLTRIPTLVNNPDTLADALSFAEGTGSTYAYPAGDMFLRYLAKQSLNVTPMIGNSSQAQTFSYNTADGVVSGYKDGDVINYNMTEGAALRKSDTTRNINDFLLTEYTANFQSSNYLIVRDARGKLITLNTSAGIQYAYMSPTAGEVDGRNFNGGANYQFIFGANYADNTLRAGNGGSELWGGNRGNDTLFGGTGADSFNYYFDGGNDTIYNAESQDGVFLGNMTLDKISAAQITDNGVNLTFTDGGTLNISGQAGYFVLENNDTFTTYKADYQNKTWSQEF